MVNGSIGIIQEIIFKENQSLPSHSLPIAIMIEFDNYSGPTILAADGKKLIPIVSVRHTWKGKKGLCSRLQISLCLAWAITMHKSQGLTLEKTVIDLRRKEFAAGLSFVTISWIPTLNNMLFSPFSLKRLHHIKNCKRLHERIAEENCLISMIPQNDC